MKEGDPDRGVDMTLRDIDLDTLTPEAAQELLCDGERMDQHDRHQRQERRQGQGIRRAKQPDRRDDRHRRG